MTRYVGNFMLISYLFILRMWNIVIIIMDFFVVFNLILYEGKSFVEREGIDDVQ